MRRDHKVVLSVHGDVIPVSQFIAAVHEMCTILGEIDLAIAGKTSLAWDIGELRKGSPATLEAIPRPLTEEIPDHSEAVIAAYAKGIEQLNKSPIRPPYFADEALGSAKRLARILDDQIDKITTGGIVAGAPFKAITITQHLAANVDELIGVREVFSGSIEGTLEVVSIHGGFSFHVYDLLTGRKVTCHCDEDSLKALVGYLGRRVLVFGEIRANAKGLPISIGALSYRVLREKGELPQPAEIQKTMSSAEFDAQELSDYLRGGPDSS